MFDRLIKNYSYKAGESSISSKRTGYIKNGNFELVERLSSDTAVIAQKKNTNAATDRMTDRGFTPGQPAENNLQKYKTESRPISVAALASESSQSAIEKVKEKLKSDFDEKLKNEIDHAYKKGFTDGKKQGLSDGMAQINRLSGVLSSIRTELEKKSAEHLADIEKAMIDFSSFLTKKIIDDAASKIPDVIKSNVRQCVGLLAGTGKVLVNINPEDYQHIQLFLPELTDESEGKFTFIVEPKETISRGGCTLEMNGSVIDGRIETQIENIRHSLAVLS